MTDAYKRLKAILEELFQLDQADLDFGIYRIMNQKREEINDFLDNELLTQISDILEASSGEDQKALAEKLSQLETTLREAGVDPETNDKVKELRAKLLSPEGKQAMENEVYSHLTNFFHRYYKDGDFISQRRYKEDVYAIPYEGEEVKLYWANHDQYYIKTSEYFKDFRFTLRDGRKVHFRLRDASTEKDNNKSQSNLERRFKLAEEDTFTEENDELNIWFNYEPLPKKQKQEKLMEQAFERLKADLPQKWLTELLVPKPTKKNKNRTLLEKYLKDYTARNTFDYFIHKDLGKFLNRELDFYIKNEVLYLDDINLDKPQDFSQQLQLIKALKSVARKIIGFLAQLEDFQKKLWLKKKFVLQSEYCITLDRIDQTFYKEIAELAEVKIRTGSGEEKNQREEWIDLFSIDELNGYSTPLTVDFLKANPFLQVDTQFFPREWKYKLLATIDHLDEQTDGLLINSENFQALRLLEERYRERVKCIYIDPPYNTVHSQILYKNQYRHSSWLSLINNTVPYARYLLDNESSFGFAIDDYELPNLLRYTNDVFFDWDVNIIVINHHPQGAGGRLSRTHEYYIVCSNSESPNLLGEPLGENIEERPFMRSGKAENNFRYGRWKSFYALLYNPVTNQIVNAEDPIPLEEEYPTSDINGLKRIYPINSRGEERVWRSSYLTGRNRAQNGELILSGGGAVYQIIKHGEKRKTLFSNWTESKFNSGPHGTDVLEKIGLGNEFDYPKSINAIITGLWAQTFGNNESVILDYFAGSATTAHGVIEMNREDNGHRKYILVEMGEYFNTVTKPRVQKVAYSKDWKNGKPEGREGISHCFKYLRLESYEDTLNNLELQRTEPQANLLREPEFREEYLLNYMLDVESRGSLLNTQMLRKPFGYTIKTTEHNEQTETEVDLIETFNYLIGLQVESIQLIRDYVVVIGTTNIENEKTLVIWRDLDKHDNAALNAFFEKMQFSTQDSEFDHIYVNGDNNLQNLRSEEQQWKVSLIEEEFHKRMFDVQEL